MMVTGVQAAGAKGVSAVQAVAVDTKEVNRLGGQADGEHETAPGEKAGEPQPVVFPHDGVGVDQRPVAMRQQQATERYREDGNPGHNDRGRDRDRH